MSNKFTTGLIAGTIGFFVFTVMTGFGLMGKRPAQSTDRQHLPPSKEASVVASEVVGNVQPWPECAKIIATIKGELGDPGSLEIVSWKKAFHDYKTGRERTDPEKPFTLCIQVKFRARNNVGAMAVYEQNFTFVNGQISQMTHDSRY